MVIPTSRPHWTTVPCNPWQGRRHSAGYGVFSVHSIEIYAHRRAWEEAYGPIPDGLHVLHHCDNPPCREPLHLFLGTNTDNIADRVAKGRTYNPSSLKTHCKRGHPFDEKNTYHPTSGKAKRMCKACRNAFMRARRRGVSIEEVLNVGN